MLSEDFDKRIKEAADQHHPAYDEKAWQKMEKLLHEHLPQQKDDRRRILFFLLLFILIGGGAYMVISKPWNKNAASDQVARENKTKVPATTNENTNKNNGAFPNTKADKPDQDKNRNVAIVPGVGKINTGNSVVKLPVDKNAENIAANKTLPVNDRNAIDKIGSVRNSDNEDRSAIVTNHNQKDEQKSTADNDKDQNSTHVNAVENKTSDNHPDENKTTSNHIDGNEVKANKDEQVSSAEPKKSAQQKKTLHNNGFSFFVAVGPDVSKAGSSRTGKTTVLYGAGIGYTKDRFTLRSGVFVSKKIYWAGSNDYKLSFVPPMTTKFEGADANCDVIEIPVKLSYMFDAGKKSNWFAGAGLSSYLMKKEKYLYAYKTTSSTYYFPYETKNENKHYFSVLNLSAGYTRKLNNTISISAEPYAEIPLTGIGVGKVHLNSGGILFTMSIKPFKK